MPSAIQEATCTQRACQSQLRLDNRRVSMFNTDGKTTDTSGRKDNTLRKLERMNRALSHQEPDRVPLDYTGGNAGIDNRLMAHFGLQPGDEEGLLTALGGFMQTAYAGASTTTIGSLLELDAIAACVIGGTSLKGGRGTVLGVIFGSLIMASLINGMTLMSVRIEYNYIARGAVLALAVWIDVRLAAKT